MILLTPQEAYDAANAGKAGWYSSSCGHIELAIAFDDAAGGSHQGRCDDDIAALREVPYIAAQLDMVSPENLRRELSEFGAWDADELADHDANLSRLLWAACGDIMEERK